MSEARREAEALYAEGYAKVEEAKKDRDAGGKKAAKNARKKFQKAIGRFEDAVARSPEYYEAWNMIGYCARNLGDLTRAFEAYDKALSINPDFDEAHEYLGEAYLQSGDLAKARLQLEWLRNHDSDEAEELAEKIDAAERARGETGGETPKPASDEGAPEPQESSEEAQ